MEEVLSQLLQQEQELQFTHFNEETAWKLGSLLVDLARQQGLGVTIDITRGEQQLFHASMAGTSADNDDWVRRKTRLVQRFGHSSFYIGNLLKAKGRSLEEAYFIPESQYAAHGGCFPIIVKGSGMLGTVTVSGLPQAEDHRLVTQAIRDFLAKES